MVQTRSAVKRVTEENPVKKFPGDLAPLQSKKRRQEGSTATSKKRRRGKPGEICQLNLDVLFLIAAYVHPIDLLNLARTCKSLRHLLMDRSSTFVWKTARGQVKGLPDCPTDLTEPEYANLVFFARCHGCGKYAKNILWKIRRRYCLDCKAKRLCPLSSCHEVIHRGNILAIESIKIEGNATFWVDKEQMESFMHEFVHSSDEMKFLRDKEEQYLAICQHAYRCEKWERDRGLERRYALDVRRKERDDSIFERLNQLGYEREVAHFGTHVIRLSRKTLFRKSKPLTNKEWNLISPQLLETMNSLRSQRLEAIVYPHRRRLLISSYASYVTRPSLDRPSFGLLPHVIDVAHLLPFKDVIMAPEEIQMNDNSFAAAFEQLPDLVDKWRNELDAEVAELVKIPSHLSSKHASDSQVMTGPEAPQAATDRLRLACALFCKGNGLIFTHPDVFSTSMLDFTHSRSDRYNWERTGSILERYNVRYVAQAPCVIHACGMDPNVTTADDMDRLNARLKCLSCKNSRVRRWRDAVSHAHFCHLSQSPDFESSCWQVISAEHLPDIQVAEELLDQDSRMLRCLLCLPHVGDAKYRFEIAHHFEHDHNIKEADIKYGVHYKPLDMAHETCSVEMVEEGENVTFKDPHCFSKQ